VLKESVGQMQGELQGVKGDLVDIKNMLVQMMGNRN
jgi:hypothetical protein